MVKNKNKLKQQKIVSEDMLQVKNLIILLFIVIIICLGIYFLTEKLIQNENKTEEPKQEVSIDYDIATIGTMFNRPESEYFVLLYSSEENGNDYDTILNQYRSSDNYIKTYYIDLDKKINNSVLADKLIEKPKDSKEVNVTGPTLYKIKEGKVVKCYSTLETIKDALK